MPHLPRNSGPMGLSKTSPEPVPAVGVAVPLPPALALHQVSKKKLHSATDQNLSCLSNFSRF